MCVWHTWGKSSVPYLQACFAGKICLLLLHLLLRADPHLKKVTSTLIHPYPRRALTTLQEAEFCLLQVVNSLYSNVKVQGLT